MDKILFIPDNLDLDKLIEEHPPKFKNFKLLIPFTGNKL